MSNIFKAAAALNEHYIKLVENSVSVPDQSTNQLCRTAKEAGGAVVMGMIEQRSESSGASLYNSLLFIDDLGEVMGRHRKLILTGGERLIWVPAPFLVSEYPKNTENNDEQVQFF